MKELHGIVRDWQSSMKKNPAGLGEALRAGMAEYAYHSARISHRRVTEKQVQDLFSGIEGEIQLDPIVRQEMLNERDCMEFMIASLAERKPITAEMVCRMNALICRDVLNEKRFLSRGEKPGEFKKHDYIVGSNSAGSYPENVAADLDSLLQESSDMREDILSAAAWMHCQFMYISPFCDGNGRVGRHLLRYFLLLHDWPPVTIQASGEETYYDALDSYAALRDTRMMKALLQRSLRQEYEMEEAQ